MADLTVLVVVICSFICSVYVQEPPAAINTFPSFQPLNRPGLPAPVNGRPQGYRRKPCPRRRMNDEGGVLVTSPQDQPLQNSESLPPVQNDDEFDCNIDLNAVNSDSQQFAKGSGIGMSSKPTIGTKIINILKDCADNKLKMAKDEPENTVDPQLLKGSRRSMGGPDDNNNNVITDQNEEVLSKTGNPGVPDVQGGSEIGQVPMTNQNKEQRVCYACSSATNPSCWKPDTRTTIKYCRPNQQCVTKSFGKDDSLTVIRDCAYSCVASSVPGVQPEYKQCKLCDNDLCNVYESNANSAIINSYNVAFILVIAAIKFTL